MLRLIESLGDRMLSLVVPKTTAAAAACQAGWGAYCDCRSGRPRYLYCECVNGIRRCDCKTRSGVGVC